MRQITSADPPIFLEAPFSPAKKKVGNRNGKANASMNSDTSACTKKAAKEDESGEREMTITNWSHNLVAVIVLMRCEESLSCDLFLSLLTKIIQRIQLLERNNNKKGAEKEGKGERETRSTRTENWPWL